MGLNIALYHNLPPGGARRVVESKYDWRVIGEELTALVEGAGRAS